MKFDIVFIIVVIIIALLTIRGAHRGLRGILFGVIAWVFTLGFVSWMTPKAEDYLLNSTYKEWVYVHVEENIRQKADAQVEEKNNSLEDLVDGLELPVVGELLEIAQDTTEQKIEEAKEAMVAGISEELTKRVVSATAMMVSLVMALIICLVISLMLRVVHELPIVGGISRLIGGVWGFFEGLLAVWVLFILTTSLTVSELGQTVMVSIANNPILLYLYQNNLILKVVDQIRNAIGG
ncbi:MAG: CvpA family protein [Lachnospiraceae bacterium]|nr:CvpA family protein [Lachnospiraceae bacterium]